MYQTLRSQKVCYNEVLLYYARLQDTIVMHCEHNYEALC